MHRISVESLRLIISIAVAEYHDINLFLRVPTVKQTHYAVVMVNGWLNQNLGSAVDNKLPNLMHNIKRINSIHYQACVFFRIRYPYRLIERFFDNLSLQSLLPLAEICADTVRINHLVTLNIPKLIVIIA